MASAAVAAAQAGTSRAPKRNFISRVFGYDLIISFALGPPPRGTHSYASDLARRLRELDFTVFFSEDEASPGEQLDSTLINALYRSRTVVVIANRGTLQEPRLRTRQTDHSALVQLAIQSASRPTEPLGRGRAAAIFVLMRRRGNPYKGTKVQLPRLQAREKGRPAR
jgi:hypothetical protein